MFRWVVTLFLLLFLSSVHAQTLGEERTSDSDRGFLTGLLEDSLGGEGRIVRVDGFTGALSATASIQRITIADTDGVWLDMRDLSMQWNRSALLRGRIEIAKLHAGTVTLARAPLATPDEDLTPEAGGFSLPNLPVSLDIQSVTIDALSLGDSILGRPARLSMQASASLIDGTAKAVLKADRTDGQSGTFSVDASYADASQQVVLSIDLQEAANGIAANALDLRGRPSVVLSVQGSGPITDFETSLDLQTDGAPRVVGTVRIQENSADAVGFAVDLSGDLIPLFPLDYAEFLGAKSTIMARGQRLADGGLDLSQFALTTGATDLQGAVVLSPDNWPVKIDISGQMAAPDGGALALPGSDETLTVDRVGLTVRYDERVSDAVSAQFDFTGLVGVDFALQNLSLNTDGALSNADARVAAFEGDVQFSAAGLDFDDADLQAAAGSALQGSVALNYATGAPFTLNDLVLSGAGFDLMGDVSIKGLDAEFRTDLDVDLQASDISRFSGLAGTALQGAVDVALTGFALAGGGFEMRITGQGDSLAVGIEQADAILAGQTVLEIAAVRDGDGLRLPLLSVTNEQIALTGVVDLATGASSATFKASLNDATLIDPALKGPLTVQGDAQQADEVWRVDVIGAGPFGARAQVSGAATGPKPRLNFRATLPDVEPFVPQVSGAAELEGVLWQQDATWRVDTRVQGPYNLTAGLKGRITGDLVPDVQFDVSLPDVSRVTTAVSGPVSATGRAVMLRDGLRVTADMQGPFGVTAQVDGRVTGDNAPVMTFAARLPDVQPIAPGFRGVATVAGDMRQTADGMQVQANVTGPYRSTVTVSGLVTGDAPSMSFSASLPDVAPLGAGISGPLSATGTAQQTGSAWRLDTQLAGPAQSRAQVTGTVAGDRVDVTATGSAPLGLSEPFLKPRSLQGLAQFDLQMRGAPGLDAVTGTIETTGARFSAPNFRVALENIGAQISVQNGVATLLAEGQIATGGQVRASGQVNLTGGLQSALAAEFQAVRLVDPTLYNVQTSGRITVDGPLTGGALIAGQINIDEAQIQVPSSPATGFSIIPQIAHRNAPAGVRQTLSRAGLETTPGPSGSTGPAQVFGLDISVDAPAKMFVRGRGLDAELGGALRITGDTGNVVSVGGFELIRGRLDVLGKRFNLDEGKVILQGQFDPFLRFVATTETDTGTASVIIDGPASKPNVRFESSPSGPEDEVLAQIFFGRSAAQLTPFQALQLASAVASLTGEGKGLVSELRLKFDLDDLDVTTDEDGAVGLQLGKYLSDNVYVDVLIGDRDDAGVSLNIDLNPSVTMRGTAKADGGGAFGIFFEKDY